MIELLTTQTNPSDLLGLGILLIFVGAVVGQSLGWFHFTKRDYRTDTKYEHYVERMVAHPDEQRRAHEIPYGARRGSIRKEPIWEEGDDGHKTMIGHKMLLANHCYYRKEIDPDTGEPMKVWCQDNIEVSDLLNRGYDSEEIKDKLL